MSQLLLEYMRCERKHSIRAENFTAAAGLVNIDLKPVGGATAHVGSPGLIRDLNGTERSRFPSLLYLPTLGNVRK